MNVFVVGSGRCGTVTFSSACKHIVGFSSSHETRTDDMLRRFKFPNYHIEVDNRLSWFIPRLAAMYPDAMFVHILRNKRSVVDSFASRAETSEALQSFRLGPLRKTGTWKQVAILYVETVLATINSAMETIPNTCMWLDIETCYARDWDKFTDALGVERCTKGRDEFLTMQNKMGLVRKAR